MLRYFIISLLLLSGCTDKEKQDVTNLEQDAMALATDSNKTMDLVKTGEDVIQTVQDVRDAKNSATKAS